MVNFGRVSSQTRGTNQLPQFYEDLFTCALGGWHVRAGSPCDF